MKHQHPLDILEIQQKEYLKEYSRDSVKRIFKKDILEIVQKYSVQYLIK